MNETRKRIRVAVAAYAYEMRAAPIMSDSEFDALAASIDLAVPTSRPEMDFWFICNFQPHTGSWIWKHPDLKGIERIYSAYFSQTV